MQKTVINIGDRIDMTHVKSSVRRKLSQDTYASSVLDYDGRRMMRISAPMFESKLIPVQIEDEYELCIYTSTELYKTRVKIVRRFREGKVWIVRSRCGTGLFRARNWRFVILSVRTSLKTRKRWRCT